MVLNVKKNDWYILLFNVLEDCVYWVDDVDGLKCVMEVVFAFAAVGTDENEMLMSVWMFLCLGLDVEWWFGDNIFVVLL